MSPSTDTRELRQRFIDEFLWTADIDVHAVTMDDLLEILDQELGAAKQKYGALFSTDAAWANAMDWLEDEGYPVDDIDED